MKSSPVEKAIKSFIGVFEKQLTYCLTLHLAFNFCVQISPVEEVVKSIG